MKTFLWVTLAFLLLAPDAALALSKCKTSLPETYVPIEKRYEKGILFKIVSSCDIPASYLTGTIHSDQQDVYGSVEDSLSLLTAARIVALEYLDDEHSGGIVDRHMFFPDNSKQNLPSVIGEAMHKRVQDAIRKLSLLPSHAEVDMRPWAIALLLQYDPPSADGVVLDERLQQLAAGAGIKLAGLETLDEQLSIFSRLPMSQQITMLKDALDHLDAIQESNRRMKELYISKDLNGLMKLADENFKLTSDHVLEKKLRRILLDQRNRNMASRAQPLLEDGNAFIAIGALHLLGQTGMLKELEKAGYQIEVVKP